MRILALDTATRATATALCDSGAAPLEARDDPPPGERPRHAARLLALTASLLERSGLGWADIECIAVGVGPGTFTGLRIGIATARALSRSRDIPLVGVSTLQSLALGARDAPKPSRVEAVLAVLDARRGEAFVAGWRLSEVEQFDSALLSPRVATPDELAEIATGMQLPALAVGDGSVEFRRVLERAGVFVPQDGAALHAVTAINHCSLARGLRPGPEDEIQPEYLRIPDAEITRLARQMK